MGGNTMTRIATTALLAALMAVAISAQAAKTAVPKELASLQGAWTIGTFNGQSAAGAGPEIVLTFTGDKYSQSVDGTINERGSVKVDASKKPMTIELNIQEGDDRGKLQYGVFEISGTTLTCKLNMPGSTDRPTDFSVAEGFILFTAVRK
jgi:uncharacterized protein (TIGR03067 family)